MYSLEQAPDAQARALKRKEQSLFRMEFSASVRIRGLKYPLSHGIGGVEAKNTIQVSAKVTQQQAGASSSGCDDPALGLSPRQSSVQLQ